MKVLSSLYIILLREKNFAFDQGIFYTKKNLFLVYYFTMLSSYKKRFADLLSPHLDTSADTLVDLIQIAPENIA